MKTVDRTIELPENFKERVWDLDHRVCPYVLYQYIKDIVMARVESGKVRRVNYTFIVQMEIETDLEGHMLSYVHVNRAKLDQLGPDLHRERFIEEQIHIHAEHVDESRTVVEVEVKDIDQTAGTGGQTRLHMAATEGNMDEVVRLVVDGANVHAKDGFGFKARDRAKMMGHDDVADYLNGFM